MNVSPLPADAAAYAASKATTTTGSNMGSDQFMQLLLAEMKNQNPLDPVQDKDFMAQITQLNSLQAMNKVSANMQSLTLSNQMIQAADLIGKTISYAAADGTTHSGVVSGVSYLGNQISLAVGSAEIGLTQLTGVQGAAGLTQASNG